MNSQLSVYAKKRKAAKANKMYHNGKFETGAETFEVNTLILFADNTPALVQMRDDIYTQYNKGNQKHQTLRKSLEPFYIKVKETFIRELKEDDTIVKYVGRKEVAEFISIYADGFESWKKEKERNPVEKKSEYLFG